MRYVRIPVALLVTVALMALTASAVAGHNAGCVETGSGRVVTVGSGKPSPEVAEQNPRSSDDPPRQGNFLDLTPDTTGDQYGARYAADQGNSAVGRPGTCG
jgi:hypothetical protein